MTEELKVDVWSTESIEYSTVDKATDAIENLADQLGTPADISYRYIYPGNDDHETYDEYISEFEGEVTHRWGRRSLLIYKSPFRPTDGGDRDSHPNLGMSRSWYSRYEQSYAIVNGNIVETDLTDLAYFLGIGAGAVGDWFASREASKIFENVVQHEILHAMLTGRRAPQFRDDHSYGEVKSSFWRARDRASPMLTGYTEPRLSNDAPAEFCREDSSMAENWTDTLSSCTEDEAKRWLNEEYDGNDDDGPPPCQPGQPC